MSWFIAAIAHELSADRRGVLASVHPEPLHRVDRGGLYIACGGFDRTCHYGSLPLRRNEPGGWLATGTALVPDDAGLRPATADDWNTLLTPPRPELDSIDGHFAALRWSDGGVEVFTDQLGMRTCYATRLRDCTVVSTRLDWLSQLRGGAGLNLMAFGPHWLSYNSFVSDSLLCDIDRIGSGARVRCTPYELDVRERPWTPDADRAAGGDIAVVLRRLLSPALEVGQRLSLGISGGFDSRVLLALMSTTQPADVVAHTFGPASDPDVELAMQMAAAEGVRLLWVDEPLPEPDACIELLRAYSVESLAVEPASSALKLRYYPMLAAADRVAVDGGMGEIARRQFANRLARRGRGATARRDVETVARHLSQHRASVFTPEVVQIMHQGVLAQLERALADLPEIPGDSDEQLIDLLIARTRYANMAGFEQARADNHVVSYMPYAQPSFLNAVFALRLGERRNGRRMRKIITENAPALAGYPLVKSGVRYPFKLPTVPAWAYTKVRSRVVGGYHDPTAELMLRSIEPFVRDLAASRSVRENAHYNPAAIDSLVQRFYSGDSTAAPELDWWLGLEMWRKGGGRRAEG